MPISEKQSYNKKYTLLLVYLSVLMVCVRMYACVRERETDRESESEQDRLREREREKKGGTDREMSSYAKYGNLLTISLNFFEGMSCKFFRKFFWNLSIASSICCTLPKE